MRQRATAAEEALEAAEERSEKYRAMIDEANIELNQFKEKVCPGSMDRPSCSGLFNVNLGIQNTKSNRIIISSRGAIALSSGRNEIENFVFRGQKCRVT